MGFSSERGSEFDEGLVDQFFGEVHGDLAGEGDIFAAGGATEVAHADAKDGGDAFEDAVYADAVCGLRGEEELT